MKGFKFVVIGCALFGLVGVFFLFDPGGTLWSIREALPAKVYLTLGGFIAAGVIAVPGGPQRFSRVQSFGTLAAFAVIYSQMCRYNFGFDLFRGGFGAVLIGASMFVGLAFSVVNIISPDHPAPAAKS